MSEQEFPFAAWDRIEQKRVTVVGRYNVHMYRLKSGYLARIGSVTTTFPAWFVEAEQREADARSERETQRGALDVGVQR